MMTDDILLVAHWIKEESQWQSQFQGWDFSKLIHDERIQFNTSEEKLGWDYAKIVCESISELANVNTNQINLLDLGTGGGEFLESLLLKLSSLKNRLTVYATESYQPNFILAQQRLNQYGVVVIHTESDSLNSTLPLNETEFKFDLIVSRHTCYNIREVDRLLKPDTGIFVTEQVDGTSEKDLIECFGREPQWPFFTLAYATSVIREQAPMLELVKTIEAETQLIFKDINALIIYLHAVPWLIEDFSVEKYQNVLLNFYRRKSHELIFTSKYMLVKVIKRKV